MLLVQAARARSAGVSAASEFVVQQVRSTRSDNANVLALRALDVAAGKRERCGVKIKLASHAGKFSFARDDSLELDIAGLLCTLEASKVDMPVVEGVEQTSKSETVSGVKSVREIKQAKLLRDSRENQRRGEVADALPMRDASAKSEIKIGESSMVASASHSEGTVRELGVASETERTAPCLDYSTFDPELDERLKHDAEEMVQELHDECESRERARANKIKASSGSVNQIESAENEQTDDSGIAGMRVDNRYYLTVVLGGHEYKALFDPGATLSLARPRVTETVKGRLKAYDSVIRSVNGKVTPVVGELDLMLDVNGEPKIG